MRSAKACQKTISVLEIRRKYASFKTLLAKERRAIQDETCKLMEYVRDLSTFALELHTQDEFLINLLDLFGANRQLLLAYEQSIAAIEEQLNIERSKLQYDIIDSLEPEIAAKTLKHTTLSSLHALIDGKYEQLKRKKANLIFLKKKISDEAEKINAIFELAKSMNEASEKLVVLIDEIKASSIATINNLSEVESIEEELSIIITFVTSLVTISVFGLVTSSSDSLAAHFIKIRSDLDAESKNIAAAFAISTTARGEIDEIMRAETAKLNSARRNLNELNSIILRIKETIPRAKIALSSTIDIFSKWNEIEDNEEVNVDEINSFLIVADKAQKELLSILEQFSLVLQFNEGFILSINNIRDSVTQSVDKLSLIISRANSKIGCAKIQELFSRIDTMPPKLEKPFDTRELSFKEHERLFSEINIKIASIEEAIASIMEVESDISLSDDVATFKRCKISELRREKSALLEILHLIEGNIRYIDTERRNNSDNILDIEREFSETQRAIHSSGNLNNLGVLTCLHDKLELLHIKANEICKLAPDLLSVDDIDKITYLRGSINKLRQICSKRIEEISIEHLRAENTPPHESPRSVHLDITTERKHREQAISRALRLSTRSLKSLEFIKTLIMEKTRAAKSLNDTIIAKLGTLGFREDTVGGSEALGIVLLDPDSESSILAKFSFHREHAKTKESTRMFNIRNLVKFLTDECGITAEVLEHAIDTKLSSHSEARAEAGAASCEHERYVY